MKRYIIALDEGTTSTRAVLYDLKKKKIERIASRPLEQFYPKLGYVEENAAEIYAETLSALAETIESVADTNEIAGIGSDQPAGNRGHVEQENGTADL